MENIKACQLCKAENVDLKHVHFNQNIGYLIAHHHSSIKATLCKRCINNVFKKFTLITLVFGWWSTKSFFLTPVFILQNIYVFLQTRDMNE